MADETNVSAATGQRLDRLGTSRPRRFGEKVFLAALGAIPWVGGFIAALASYKLEGAAAETNELQNQWLEEHEHKMQNLRSTLTLVGDRLESLGPEIEQRIESEEYLALVRRAFRTWDRADTEEKRKYVANLITNAAGKNIASDDVVRLFIDWLDSYHEAHFHVIREIYNRPRSTRHDVGVSLYGHPLPRDDSAEADLFRRLFRDLSTGGVIRQERETTADGQFLRKQTAGQARRPASRVVESSFDTEGQYVLTGLGEQFVHYTIAEVVPRISGAPE